MPTQVATIDNGGALIRIADASDHFREWLDKFVGGKAHTKTAYTTALKSFWRFLQSQGADFWSTDESTVQQYVDFLDANKSTATKNLYLLALKNFFKYLQAKGVLIKNPTEFVKIRSQKTRKFHKGFLMPNKAAELIRTADGADVESLRNKAFLALVLTAGLRACEVVRADLKDFDHDPNGTRILWVFGKGRDGKDEFVKIAPQVETLIKDYLNARQTTQGGLLGADEPLFVACGKGHRGRLTERTLSKIAKNALKKIGFDSPRYTLHSLRHTCATTILQGGGSEFEASQVLRHKDLTTTKIYTHELSRLNNKAELNVAKTIFSF